MHIIGGKWKGQRLITPSSQAVRPSAARLREALFAILSARGDDDLAGRHVLDLFAGTGAFGFEALSRGAARCLFVDKAHAATTIIRANINKLKAQSCSRIYRHDATRVGALPAFARPGFNLVFADPPYGCGLAELALRRLLAKNWLPADAVIIIEEACRSGFLAPDGFCETDRRRYGDSELIFLALAKNKSAS